MNNAIIVKQSSTNDLNACHCRIVVKQAVHSFRPTDYKMQ